jgi:hypothetical protein
VTKKVVGVFVDFSLRRFITDQHEQKLLYQINPQLDLLYQYASTIITFLGCRYGIFSSIMSYESKRVDELFSAFILSKVLVDSKSIARG